MRLRKDQLEVKDDLIIETTKRKGVDVDVSREILRITNGQFEAFHPTEVLNNQGETLAWQALSLCAQTDPELFFAEKGYSYSDAQAICDNCEVRPECLADRLNRRDVHYGFRAGYGPMPLRALLKELGIEIEEVGEEDVAA
ncbi:MAG: WhiB family transcriptional regulator [Candidatus Microsaccharimonas sp.]